MNLFQFGRPKPNSPQSLETKNIIKPIKKYKNYLKHNIDYDQHKNKNNKKYNKIFKA